VADETRKLELRQVLQADAAEIIAARTKALLIHHTGDIDAAGDEVEVAVRAVLRRKLPLAYYVGHGHIIDSRWNTSPQQDVIIADNAGAPILFQTQNGTEYFPYESVYAIGEVKSSYAKSKQYIHRFVAAQGQIKSTLQRQVTPPNYIGPSFSLADCFSVTNVLPCKNPLFSFMVFVSGKDFELGHISDLYLSRPAAELPNLLCFLDHGIVANIRIPVKNDAEPAGPLNINLYPAFNQEEAGMINRWAFMPVGASDYRPGGCLGFLYFALASHLRSCMLMPPDMLAYLQPVFAFGGPTEVQIVGSLDTDKTREKGSTSEKEPG
jgi:hypothetical protein